MGQQARRGIKRRRPAHSQSAVGQHSSTTRTSGAARPAALRLLFSARPGHAFPAARYNWGSGVCGRAQVGCSAPAYGRRCTERAGSSASGNGRHRRGACVRWRATSALVSLPDSYGLFDRGFTNRLFGRRSAHQQVCRGAKAQRVRTVAAANPRLVWEAWAVRGQGTAGTHLIVPFVALRGLLAAAADVQLRQAARVVAHGGDAVGGRRRVARVVKSAAGRPRLELVKAPLHLHVCQQHRKRRGGVSRRAAQPKITWAPEQGPRGVACPCFVRGFALPCRRGHGHHPAHRAPAVGLRVGANVVLHHRRQPATQLQRARLASGTPLAPGGGACARCSTYGAGAAGLRHTWHLCQQQL